MVRRVWVAAACLFLVTAPASAAIKRRAPAAAAGLSAAQRAAIDRYVTAEMARQRIPGLELGVYRDGRPLLEKGYGLANLEWGVPTRADTLMQSGSIGKQFAAVAVMMLVQEGRVGLDDSVRKYFPEAPESWAPIKVKNLLSHTAGIAEYEEGPMAEPGGEFDLRRDFTEDELVAKLAKLPLESPPGAAWAYRNSGYLLLGVLIHRVTGKPWADVLRERIFAPLGMSSTRVVSDADVIPRRAAGYEIKGGRLNNQAFVSATFNSTADGTLYFNLPDIARWDRALDGERLLPRAALQRMWTPFVLNDGKPNGSGYGFAWFTGEVNGRRVVEHSGSWQGFTTMLSRHVDDRLTVAVLTNLDSAHARPRNIERVVAGLVVPRLMPKPTAPAIPDAAPAVAERTRRVLAAIADGRDASADLSDKTTVKIAADSGPELAAALPPGWRAAPLTLVRRRQDDGATASAFRLGPPGDTRMVTVHTDAAGKLLDYAVTADPDSR